MRVGRFLLIVGVITISSVFYIYQQCMVAFRPLEKRIQQLSSLEFYSEGEIDKIQTKTSIPGKDGINDGFSIYNAKLQIAKK